MRRGLSYHNRRSAGGYNPFSQLGPTLDLIFAGNVTNLSDPNGFTLDANFLAPQYLIGEQYTIWETGVGLVSKTFSQIITFPRASTATFFNSAGVLTSAAIDAPRLDYNPSTLAAQGLLIEEARTNSIRNNTMVGAAAGTPGTLPTNWQVFTNVTGLTRQIVGTGTENGITYIEVKLSGTPSGSGVYQFQFEPSNAVAALTAQTWTASSYLKLQAGSYAGVSSNRFGFSEYTSGGAFITFNTVVVASATSAALSTQRATATQTLNGGATTAFLLPYFELVLSGAAIDITLRIGLPQLELGAFATSVIPTTTTALTRSADVAAVNTLSPWYNSAASTIYGEWTNLAATMPSGSVQTVSNVNDTTGNNQQSLFQLQAASTKASANMFSGGVNAGRLDAGGAYSNATVKAAAAYAALDRAISVNGNAAVTSAVGALPVSVTRLELGNAFLANALNGYLRRITYYPRRLSNAELQAITT